MMKEFVAVIFATILRSLFGSLGPSCVAFVTKVLRRGRAGVQSPPNLYLIGKQMDKHNDKPLQHDLLLNGFCGHNGNHLRSKIICYARSLDEIRKTWGDDDDDTKKPESDAFYKEMAKDAFARRYFYYPKGISEETEEILWQIAESISTPYQRMRDAKFKDLLVEEVLKKDNLEKLFSTVGISDFEERIKPFVKGLTNEGKLAREHFIALNNPEEVNNYNQQHVSLKASTERQSLALDAIKLIERNKPLIFVLGSSGSGKTFVALELGDAYKLDSKAELDSTTVYLNVANFASDYISTFTAKSESDVAKQRKQQNEVVKPLVDWIWSKIKSRLNLKEEVELSLNMHISVVIDEAGSPALKGIFEKTDVVDDLIAELKRNVTSVLLIITGTGVTATAYSSRNECYKVRLTPWTVTDLFAVFKKKLIRFKASHVIGAIYQQPTLYALATNARSAAFLLDCIKSSGDGIESPQSVNEWVLRFDVIKGSLVNNVVAKYAENNGLKNLIDTIQRRRVAASILHFLYTYKKNPSVKPPFIGLQGAAEEACAPALVDFNVESVINGEVKYARDQYDTPAIMTPALVIIVFAMLGVQTEILSSFESQELVTALYALKQQVLDIMEKYQKEFANANGDKKVEQNADVNLNEQLLQLNVCRMTEHVPLFQKTALTINLPMVTPLTIWLNKPLTPGPDVVAYRVLGQAKYSENGIDVSISPWEELEKCDLLKQQSNHFGQVALQGYFDIWRGAYNKVKRNGRLRFLRSINVTVQTRSKAYPCNLLDTSRVQTAIPYKQVSRESSKAPWNYISTMKAQDDDDDKVTFLFTTNAARIKLTGQLGEDVKEGNFSYFSFNQTVLHENGTMNVDALRDDDTTPERKKLSLRAQWNKFMTSIDITKVDLKFLFT
jgi:hypothetical protein